MNEQQERPVVLAAAAVLGGHFLKSESAEGIKCECGQTVTDLDLHRAQELDAAGRLMPEVDLLEESPERWPKRAVHFGSIGLDDAVDRILQQSMYESNRYPDVPAPNAAQIASVLSALADYTSMSQAIRYAPDPTFDPPAVSAGRWMHAYADACRQRWEQQQERAASFMRP